MTGTMFGIYRSPNLDKSGAGRAGRNGRNYRKEETQRETREAVGGYGGDGRDDFNRIHGDKGEEKTTPATGASEEKKNGTAFGNAHSLCQFDEHLASGASDKGAKKAGKEKKPDYSTYPYPPSTTVGGIAPEASGEKRAKPQIDETENKFPYSRGDSR